MTAGDASRSSPRAVGLLVLACCVMVVALGFGARQTFGLFLSPMTGDLGWNRETLSLVFAVQALLNGFAAPFTGMVADKWGTGRVVFIGAVCYGVGLVIMALSTTLTPMMLGGGLLVGMGVSACGMPVMLAAVGRVAPEDKRSLWLGIVTAGATAGQLLIIPLTQRLIVNQGWDFALLVLAACFAMLIPVAMFFGAASRHTPTQNNSQSLPQALSEASRHSGFVLLTLGFFVCGFQVQFLATHLPSFIKDEGLGASLGAYALMLVAFANMIGAAYAGYLGGRARKKYLLTGIYTARSIVIAVFVLLPTTQTTVIVFCALIGFFWLATVPLTGGLIAQIFGTRYMATLYAIVFLSHQIGNFFGAWLGGRIFDTTGSYDLAWWISAGLGVIAAILHWPINDRPLERLQASASA